MPVASFVVRQEGSVVTLTVEGYIVDSNVADILYATIEKILSLNWKNIVIDVSYLVEINSLGIERLCSANQLCGQYEAVMYIFGFNPKIRRQIGLQDINGLNILSSRDGSLGSSLQ